MTTDRPDSDQIISIQDGVSNSTIVSGNGNVVKNYYTDPSSTSNINSQNRLPSWSESKFEYRSRSALLAEVKSVWIEGILKKSLCNQVLIELNLEKRSKAAAFLLRGVEDFRDVAQSLPEGTQAIDVFTALGPGRTLLILGEPGAGKTTTLLKVTQSLIERIGDDVSQLIPVVFQLSSWSEKDKTFADWLIQELQGNPYNLRRNIAVNLIAQEQLTLCLDGLDEVAVQHRQSCLAALNQFIHSHGMTEIVICSRVKEYEALAKKLHVRDAIFVQPLTSKQIDSCTEQAGEQLRLLRAAFARC